MCNVNPGECAAGALIMVKAPVLIMNSLIEIMGDSKNTYTVFIKKVCLGHIKINLRH